MEGFKMKKFFMLGWLILAFLLTMSLLLTVACGDDDDDDDNDEGGDSDDDDDDDDNDDNDDDNDDDDDDQYAFNWETVDALAPGAMVIAANMSGHDIVAATAITQLHSMTVADAVEWDMLDGVPAGDYDFHKETGDNLTAADTNYVMVIFKLNLITEDAEAAYVSVDGTADITATGGIGDQFTGSISEVIFRQFDISTGVIDWEAPMGRIAGWSLDQAIVGVK